MVKGNEIWVIKTCTGDGKRREGRIRKTKLQPSQQPQHCSISTFRPPSLRPSQLWHHIVSTVYQDLDLDLDLTNHALFESLSFWLLFAKGWCSYDDHHIWRSSKHNSFSFSSRFLSFWSKHQVFFAKSQDKNFRLIPSPKIPESQNFAKTRPGDWKLKILDPVWACLSPTSFPL